MSDLKMNDVTSAKLRASHKGHADGSGDCQASVRPVFLLYFFWLKIHCGFSQLFTGGEETIFSSTLVPPSLLSFSTLPCACTRGNKSLLWLVERYWKATHASLLMPWRRNLFSTSYGSVLGSLQIKLTEDKLAREKTVYLQV